MLRFSAARFGTPIALCNGEMLNEHARLRRRIALMGAVVFLIPFGLYMALVARVERADLRIVLLYASPFLALGVLLVAVAWNYAMNSIERLTGEL